MVHKIAHMYMYIRKQETVKVSLLIQCLHANLKSTKDSGMSHETTNLSMQLKPTNPLDPTTAPEDLEDIQLRPYQVWDRDEIIFDINGSWIKVVCTYKLFAGDRMWRTQTG